MRALRPPLSGDANDERDERARCKDHECHVLERLPDEDPEAAGLCLGELVDAKQLPTCLQLVGRRVEAIGLRGGYLGREALDATV